MDLWCFPSRHHVPFLCGWPQDPEGVILAEGAAAARGRLGELLIRWSHADDLCYEMHACLPVPSTYYKMWTVPHVAMFGVECTYGRSVTSDTPVCAEGHGHGAKLSCIRSADMYKRKSFLAFS